MGVSENLVFTQQSLQRLIDRWNNNALSGDLVNAELLAIPEFSHLTAAEVTGAITAFQAVLTALGDSSSGQLTNIIKMEG